MELLSEVGENSWMGCHWSQEKKNVSRTSSEIHDAGQEQNRPSNLSNTEAVLVTF